eukprot:Tbor_TRINITY_DN3570_c0_g1::TRINITY_DN3570_c0_g1_i2::g.2875::m.2875/K00826/E2.6.1.42, ilvE; branched-chain amino acid aminotransferase
MSFGKKILNNTTVSSATLPNMAGVPFGTIFTPHMFNVDWTMKNGWTQPELMDFQNLSLPPQASGLHYGLQCFEGMKAYCGTKGEIRLFRPDMNAARMQRSTARLCFPAFDADDLIHGIKELVKLDKSFIPKEKGYSLYIRPTAIATNANLGVAPADAIKLYVINSPVGPYYPSGFKPVKLMADTKHKRAWPGGTGEYKIGANYAGPIYHQRECAKEGFQQVLWLGPGDVVDEVGAMNFMMLWRNKDGERELITAPLDGTILPGVTRDTILSLGRQWGEFKVTEKRFTVHDMVQASEEGRLEEAFGCGTAAIVTAVEGVQVLNKYINIPVHEKSVAVRLFNAIQDIQYGVVEHSWSVVVS